MLLLTCLTLSACGPTSPPENPNASVTQLNKVVGGTPAPEDAATVALLARRSHCTGEPLTLLCSGALIAPDVVLTAAHCLDVFGPEGPYEIFLGTKLLPEPEPQGRFVRVTQAVRHPGYAHTTHRFDAALLRLATAVDTPPLPLPEPGWGTLSPDQSARVLGFGDTKDASAPSGERRQGGLTVTEVEPEAFHAGPAPAMSCVGDSGGPVLAQGADGREVLVGVTASGDVACRQEAFNVRVEALLEDFIHPFLAEPLSPPGETLAPESLCTATCTQDAECPLGLACVSEEGGPGRCLLPALQQGAYGAACAEDAQCGSGLCARLEPEGPDACRCFTPCEAIPSPGDARGCTGAPGPGALAAWVLAGWLSRRGGAGACAGRRGG